MASQSNESQTNAGRQSGSGSKADTLVKLVLVFFISLLSFSIGTFVGKQVSDGEHRRAQLDGGAGEGGDDHAAGEGNRQVASENTHDEALSDEEIRSLADEFVAHNKVQNPNPGEDEEQSSSHEAQEGHEAPKIETAKSTPDASGHGPTTRGTAAAHGANSDHSAAKQGYKSWDALKSKEATSANQAPTANATHSAPQPNLVAKGKVLDGPHQAATKLSQGESPTEGTPEKRAPSSAAMPALASSLVGKYTVQVASYGSEEEAKKQAQTLKAKGWNSFYLPAEISGRTWYRVSVGLFTNINSAKSFQKELIKDGTVTSSIVQKIIQ